MLINGPNGFLSPSMVSIGKRNSSLTSLCGTKVHKKNELGKLFDEKLLKRVMRVNG
jgi:hypothetical protein